jgi:hypothetical protein
VPFARVHLVGFHPHHVVEAQPRMRYLHVGEEHPPHPRLALAKEPASSLDLHLTHQGHCEGLELLAEVLAPPLSEQGHTVHLPAITIVSLRQGTNDHTLFVEDIQMPHTASARDIRGNSQWSRLEHSLTATRRMSPRPSA